MFQRADMYHMLHEHTHTHSWLSADFASSHFLFFPEGWSAETGGCTPILTQCEQNVGLQQGRCKHRAHVQPPKCLSSLPSPEWPQQWLTLQWLTWRPLFSSFHSSLQLSLAVSVSTIKFACQASVYAMQVLVAYTSIYKYMNTLVRIYYHLRINLCVGPGSSSSVTFIANQVHNVIFLSILQHEHSS